MVEKFEEITEPQQNFNNWNMADEFDRQHPFDEMQHGIAVVEPVVNQAGKIIQQVSRLSIQ